MAWDQAPEFASYDEVPFYRKRWFFVLSILFFIPAALVVALTGDVYLLTGGKVMKYPQGQRIGIAVVWALLMTVNIVRAFS